MSSRARTHTHEQDRRDCAISVQRLHELVPVRSFNAPCYGNKYVTVDNRHSTYSNKYYNMNIFARTMESRATRVQWICARFAMLSCFQFIQHLKERRTAAATALENTQKKKKNQMPIFFTPSNLRHSRDFLLVCQVDEYIGRQQSNNTSH